MKVISGPEPLTPHQLGAKLWNTPYKGKTIGQWAESSWHDATVDVPTLFKSEGLKILAELGLLVMFSQRYLHFMHLHKLTKALPELRPYVATLLIWEGLAAQGIPLFKEGSRSPGSAPAPAAPEPAAPAAPAKARRVKPVLAESNAPPSNTATVIQFPGRR